MQLHDTASITREMLGMLPDAFSLFPLQGQDQPQPESWADYLRENPYFANPSYKPVALEIANDRTVLETMSEEYQRLGGALVRVIFTDQELIKMHESAI